MIENNIEITDTDLFTGSEADLEDAMNNESVSDELVLEDIIKELVGNAEAFTPYKIATIINKVFEATFTDKKIPTQMMYIYASKGMIVKGNKSKSYTNDEVYAFVFKYTSKHVVL
jgi:hypothetical protein